MITLVLPFSYSVVVSFVGISDTYAVFLIMLPFSFWPTITVKLNSFVSPISSAGIVHVISLAIVLLLFPVTFLSALLLFLAITPPSLILLSFKLVPFGTASFTSISFTTSFPILLTFIL